MKHMMTLSILLNAVLVHLRDAANHEIHSSGVNTLLKSGMPAEAPNKGNSEANKGMLLEDSAVSNDYVSEEDHTVSTTTNPGVSTVDNPPETKGPDTSRVAYDDDNFLENLMETHRKNARSQPLSPTSDTSQGNYVISRSCGDIVEALRQTAYPIFADGIISFKEAIDDMRADAIKILEHKVTWLGYVYTVKTIGTIKLYYKSTSSHVCSWIETLLGQAPYPNAFQRFLHSNVMLLTDERPKQFLLSFARFFDRYLTDELRRKAFKLDCYLVLTNREKKKTMNYLLEKVCGELSVFKAVSTLYKGKSLAWQPVTWGNCVKNLQEVMDEQFKAFFAKVCQDGSDL